MCGINGFNFNDRELIESMLDATRHRGPDGSDYYSDDNISLGHNLLAITDTPDHSRQPVVSTNGELVLSYNGELFNCLELRQTLQSQGVAFQTECDTEVLIKGLEKEGIAFLYKLNGMFAIALYEKNSNKLILARDPGGVKPLYYYLEGGKVIFSSELRGILAHKITARLNMQSFGFFLDLGYVPGYMTLVQNLFKVCPGEIVSISIRNGEVMARDWLTVSCSRSPLGSVDLLELRQRIKEAVSSNLMGRRPVGVYLSGGLDSSILLYELIDSVAEVQSFTTRFCGHGDYYNEDADIARKMTSQFGIRHHELMITESDFVDSVEKVIEAIEEPRHNSSLAAYYLLAKQASSDVVVTLSGEGGDELFGGYPKYFLSSKLSAKPSILPREVLNLYNNLYLAYYNVKNRKDLFFPWIPLEEPLDDPVSRWMYLSSHGSKLPGQYLKFHHNRDDLTRYLHSWTAHLFEPFSGDMENMIMALDRHFWLADDAYLRADKIGMHFGMEARFPFGEKRLVDFANRLPSHYKLDGSFHTPKALMRKAYSGRVPAFVLEKRKSGWRAPVRHWMSSQLGSMVKEVLSADYYRETAGLFDFEEILRPARDNPASLAKREVFAIVSFQIWAKTFKIQI